MEKFKIKGGVLLKYTPGPGETVVTVPPNILKIGKYAFAHGSCPDTVIVSEGVIEIDTMAFFACEELRKVILPASLRRIGESAFDGTGLEYIVIPEGVRSIGKFAFMGCKRLREVRLPKSLTGMGEGAFATMGRLNLVQMAPSFFGKADALLRSAHINPGIVMYTDERIMTHETKSKKAPEAPAPPPEPKAQPAPDVGQAKKTTIRELATTDVSELIGRAKAKAAQPSEQNPLLFTTADYTRLEKKLQEANAKNADLLEQLAASQKETAVMQHKVHELDALFSENQALKSQIKVLNTMLAELRSESEVLPPPEDPRASEALREAEAQIRKLEEEAEDLRKKLEEAEERAADAEEYSALTEGRAAAAEENNIAAEGRIAALEKRAEEAEARAAAAEKRAADASAAESSRQLEAMQKELDELKTENHFLNKKLSSTGQALFLQSNSRIEDILDTYLHTFSTECERILASRFRETARAMLDYSAEEAVRVMQSAVIGSPSNKRLLRNLARQNGRPDIAEKIQ